MSSISILQKKWVKRYLMFCRNNHRKMSKAQGVDLLIRRRIDATHLTVQRDLWQPYLRLMRANSFQLDSVGSLLLPELAMVWPIVFVLFDYGGVCTSHGT